MKKIYTGIDTVTRNVENVVVTTEKVIDPVRQSISKRFPVILLLLVTFGVTATFYGIERVIAEMVWLNERPVLILASGLLALVITGKLYQKLG